MKKLGPLIGAALQTKAAQVTFHDLSDVIQSHAQLWFVFLLVKNGSKSCLQAPGESPFRCRPPPAPSTCAPPVPAELPGGSHGPPAPPPHSRLHSRLQIASLMCPDRPAPACGWSAPRHRLVGILAMEALHRSEGQLFHCHRSQGNGVVLDGAIQLVHPPQHALRSGH